MLIGDLPDQASISLIALVLAHMESLVVRTLSARFEQAQNSVLGMVRASPMSSAMDLRAIGRRSYVKTQNRAYRKER